ncbi:MAG: PIN domain-containing protein [Pseudomonadota bacterium]
MIDANLLCLVVAGYSAPMAIGRHKRLRAYDVDDFKRVSELIAPFDKVLTCPHILTETSNLLANTNDTEKRDLLEGLRVLLQDMEEVRLPSVFACDHKAYHRLGLTDAVLLSMELSGAPLLTVDLDLTLAAIKEGREAINYNWHREAGH